MSSATRTRPRGAGKPGDGVVVLAMELLHGETLADKLRRDGPFSTAEMLPLVDQMAAGLTAAHQAGVVHRDFKSHNVMLVKPPVRTGSCASSSRISVWRGGTPR